MQNQSCCSGESTTKQDAAGCCGNSSQSCCGDAVPDSGHESVLRLRMLRCKAENGLSAMCRPCRNYNYRRSCRFSINGALEMPLVYQPMRYTIDLYCVSNPDANSPVLVTANYKRPSTVSHVLSADVIVVWCLWNQCGARRVKEHSAQREVNRLQEVRLSMSYPQDCHPQLGAVGVRRTVQKQSGFGSSTFIERRHEFRQWHDGHKEMRTVKFTIWDRLVHTGGNHLSHKTDGGCFRRAVLPERDRAVPMVSSFMRCWAPYSGAFTPVLLPWIPGRRSLQGFPSGAAVP